MVVPTLKPIGGAFHQSQGFLAVTRREHTINLARPGVLQLVDVDLDMGTLCAACVKRHSVTSQVSGCSRVGCCIVVLAVHCPHKCDSLVGRVPGNALHPA